MNTETQTAKILVVDDEPDLQALISQKFRNKIKSKEYEFKFAYNGEEAIEKITNDGNIDLILTDINMPVMDGLTLLTKINELKNKLLRAVIVSAYGDMENIRTAMNRGAYDFITKPINLKDLEITVEKAIQDLGEFKKGIKARTELLAVRNELEEARKLQLSMLPPAVPTSNHYEFAVYMETASEVGGDYYDFSNNKDDSINVALGDATGHGMKAGIMVAIMKALFTSDSVEMDMADYFNVTNKTIKSLNLGRMMMAFSMLNIKDNKGKLINAGMPPVYHFQKNKSVVKELSQDNLPLGAMVINKYSLIEIDLNKGDVILMMSDGFPELHNPTDELLGYNRVYSFIKNSVDKEPKEIIEYLKDEGVKWSKEKEQQDDVTFVVIKIK